MKVIKSRLNAFLFLLQLCFLVIAIRGCVSFGLFAMEPSYIVNVSMNCVGIGVTILLFLSCLTGTERSQVDQYFRNIVFVESLALFSDCICWFAQGRSDIIVVNYLANSLYYFCCFTIPFIGWLYQVEIMNLTQDGVTIFTKVVKVLYVISILAIVLNGAFGFYFTVDIETGIYSRSNFFFMNLFLPVILFFVSIYYVFATKCPIQIKISFLAISILPHCGSVIQIVTFGLSLSNIATLLAIFVIYINIFVDLNQKYIASQKENLEHSREMSEVHSRLMITQVQPIFISDSLSIIQNLCKSNPDKAAQVTLMLSDFLKGNASAIDSNIPITFEKELAHTKSYIQIEEERVGSFTVEYDLKIQDFALPALSLQPLVANAIEHGMKSVIDGVIKIRTYQDSSNIYLSVEDNGKGFDPYELTENYEYSGITNIRNRVEHMVKGSLEIDSKPGKGTKAILQLPKDICQF